MMKMANRRLCNKSKDVKRVTISFPQDDYSYLEKLASKKKVSLSWVVREAVEKYIVVSKENE